MSNKNTRRQDARPLTVREAAESLNLSQACVRTWIATRKIGFVRLGRAIRIPEAEISRLLSQGAVAALAGVKAT